MSFIKQQQEVAREKRTTFSYNTTNEPLTHYTYSEEDLDSLISQVVQNTCAEIDKKLYETGRTKCYESVQSLLREITSDKTEVAS